ncbi:N-6 DNA methylase [Saccharothrix sp. HUAS TT1]|uniref:N-6 DNA methylase n=1 Tax=unclassified Saccharothrix TaxID=2593673 RepID=UPI00345C0870
MTAVKVRPGGPPRQHVLRLSERVVETWFGHHGGNNLEIPMSVVAVMSLLSPPHEERQAAIDETAGMSPEAFGGVMGVLWQRFVRARPDLVNPVWPFVRIWVGSSDSYRMSDQALAAAKAVGDTLLRHDLFSLADNRYDVDLLGQVLTELRPKSSLQARGQFYTPPDVCQLMAAMTVLGEGESVSDPALGSGGMFRGAAQAMREQGLDPTTVTWIGNDIDDLAIAAAAVNAVLWNLGPNVVLGVANALTEPDWVGRAVRMRNEMVSLARNAMTLDLLRGVEQLIQGAAAEGDEDRDGGDEQRDEVEDDRVDEPVVGDEPEPEPAGQTVPEPPVAEPAAGPSAPEQVVREQVRQRVKPERVEPAPSPDGDAERVWHEWCDDAGVVLVVDAVGLEGS